MIDQLDNGPEGTLDPDDWSAASELAHRIVDDAVLHLSSLRGRPAWQDMPETVRAAQRTRRRPKAACLGRR